MIAGVFIVGLAFGIVLTGLAAGATQGYMKDSAVMMRDGGSGMMQRGDGMMQMMGEYRGVRRAAVGESLFFEFSHHASNSKRRGVLCLRGAVVPDEPKPCFVAFREVGVDHHEDRAMFPEVTDILARERDDTIAENINDADRLVALREHLVLSADTLKRLRSFFRYARVKECFVGDFFEWNLFLNSSCMVWGMPGVSQSAFAPKKYASFRTRRRSRR